jgi:GTPase SAR1 family protein
VIFLVGNKCDLEAQRDVTYEEARQFAEENNLMYCETSAKTGQSVEVVRHDPLKSVNSSLQYCFILLQEAFIETATKIFQNIQVTYINSFPNFRLKHLVSQ